MSYSLAALNLTPAAAYPSDSGNIGINSGVRGLHAIINLTALGSTPAPTNGALSATAGGALAATTYYVRSTWVGPWGETLAATETSLAVALNNVLNVAAPANPPPGATGWNVYVSTATGTETKQNGATPIALGAAWVEPTTGLVAGAALPASVAATATFTLQGYDPASNTWYTLLASAALAASGQTVLKVFPAATAAANLAANDIIPSTFRVLATIAGTAPAITGTVGLNLIY